MLFAVNQGDDTLSAINARTCQGTVTAGCSKTPPRVEAGSNHNPGYTGRPNTMTLLPGTDTAYLVNVGGENRVSVITVGSCNAIERSGCRVPAPTAPNSEAMGTIDPATDTIYASNSSLPEVDVLNGATCHPEHVTGCAPVAEIPMDTPFAFLGAASIDEATHTLYVSGSSGVSVVNTSTCNATNVSGCAAPTPQLAVAPGPGRPAVNEKTGTLYLSFGKNANKIAVLNAATCNAEVSSGCGQTPAIIKIGDNATGVAVSVKTDTIYATSASGDKVFVINGATCNGTDHSGCGHFAATITVGAGPFSIAVDDATHTAYVSNNEDDGNNPGTLSVIDTATCNGTDTAGCAGSHLRVAIGRGPLTVAVDIATDTVYVADSSSAGLAVVNGSTCNGEFTGGCHTPAPERAVGSLPFGLAVNQSTDTVYVMDLGSPASLSVFRG